jgi:hypothetical protein
MGDPAKNADRKDRDAVPPEREGTGNPFARSIGTLPAFTTQDEINAWIRELRGHDEADDADIGRGNRL